MGGAVNLAKNWVWSGVIEDRRDPLKLGRCRVRIFGRHTDDKGQLPTRDLPWAQVSQPPDNGRNAVGLKEGDWVWGLYLDGSGASKPIIVGYTHGIDKDPANPERGFYDPTTSDSLVPGGLPRGPEYGNTSPTEQDNTPKITSIQIRRLIEKLDPPDDIKIALNKIVDTIFDGKTFIRLNIQDLTDAITNALSVLSKLEGEILDLIDKAKDFLIQNIYKLLDLFGLDFLENSASEFVGRFGNPNVLPGSNAAFGELLKGFDVSKSKFDLNKDGTYDEADAQMLIQQNTSPDGNFSGFAKNETSYPMCRYPLENRLNEPSTSRLQTGIKLEETIVEKKKKNLGTGEGAGHDAKDKNASSASFPFIEPQTPYAAVYPYNHVYESESGNVLEVDDTPGAERLHCYHRSGTFHEIHPAGTEVNKVVDQQYNFITSDYFLASGKSINIDAKDSIRQKSGNDFNRVVGGNLNADVSKNYHLATGQGVYVYAKDGVVFIKAVGDISIESTEGSVEIKSSKSIALSAPSIHLQGAKADAYPAIHLCSDDIRAHHLRAHSAKGLGLKPDVPEDAKPLENDADIKTEDKDDSSNSSKEGILLAEGLPGEVCKPVSASDGNMCTLSPDPTPHVLFEAIPTGQLEARKIVYEHADGTKTSWDVVRPVHTPGKVIDKPKIIKQFEDGIRWLQRWSLPGNKYPTQMFWQTGGGLKLLIDSSIRHMCKAPFNDVLPLPPMTPVVPVDRFAIESAIANLENVSPEVVGKMRQMVSKIFLGRESISIKDAISRVAAIKEEVLMFGDEISKAALKELKGILPFSVE